MSLAPKGQNCWLKENSSQINELQINSVFFEYFKKYEGKQLNRLWHQKKINFAWGHVLKRSSKIGLHTFIVYG